MKNTSLSSRSGVWSAQIGEMADDADADAKLDEFLGVVAKVETESDQWTTEKQITRLTRPGAKSVLIITCAHV